MLSVRRIWGEEAFEDLFNGVFRGRSGGGDSGGGLSRYRFLRNEATLLLESQESGQGFVEAALGGS